MSRVTIDLPVQDGQTEVVLGPQRDINFSALDYDTSRRAIIEYIKTYFPDDFNDFIASNGVMMMVEIISMCVAKLALRSDILAKESTLPTAFSEKAVVNHLALLGQKIKRQTAAIVDVECSVGTPSVYDIIIQAGTKFKISNSSDSNPVFYEIYKAPGDWTSDIVIPFGKRGVIAYGIEGSKTTVVAGLSNGLPKQIVYIDESSILDNPIFISVSSNGVASKWTATQDPIESYGPSDTVAEYRLYDDRLELIFGDNVHGKIPPIDSIISVTYRTGGGSRGRIAANMINETRYIPVSSVGISSNVTFRNIYPSSGGVDRETIDQAKIRAPLEYSIHNAIVTLRDYVTFAENYRHPYYGSVSRAMASIDPSDDNKVNVYVLSHGGDGVPALPSQGLKSGLLTYISQFNNLTDKVEILDGIIKAIDINVSVVLFRNSDVGAIKSTVDNIILKYFNDWKMGEPFFLSDFISAIGSVDGVRYVDVIEPTGNILSSNISSLNTVAPYELLSLKSYKTNYYYDA